MPSAQARMMDGDPAKEPKKEFRLWKPYLVGGQRAYRFELQNGTVAEVVPGFDLQAEGFHWGVLWPEKRGRVNGMLLVERPAKRVGGKVRIDDEDGELHVEKSIAKARELAEAAIDAGRPV
jgi:hypothetical protein